jgi:hypothetical protein
VVRVRKVLWDLGWGYTVGGDGRLREVPWDLARRWVVLGSLGCI